MLTNKDALFPNKDTQYDTHIHRDVYHAIKGIEGHFTTKEAYLVAHRKHNYLTRENVRRAVANLCGIYDLGLRRVSRGVYEWVS